MVTVVTEHGDTTIDAPANSAAGLWLSKEDAERATGWSLKPEGLCKGDICVPAPPGQAADFVRENEVNLAAFWHRMNHPAVSTGDGDVWYLGTSARERADALSSLEAPDFCLPDLDGTNHTLSDYRGRKILLATWASW